jgi:Tfp pilus assembly protein PilF
LPSATPQPPFPARQVPLLSLAMIVRDGGQNLAPLLAGAQPWVDEIVIGDTGSVDGSDTLARSHGAQVHDIPWQDDFSSARNHVLDLCRSTWVLVLDADEMLCETDWQDLRQWVRQMDSEQRFQAGSITTRNYLHDRHGRGWLPVPADDPHGLPGGAPAAGYIASTKVRLFPNRPGIRFRGQIHETVEASLWEAHIPIVDLPWAVHHFGYFAPRAEKNKCYLHLAHLKTADQPHDAQAWAELADCAIASKDQRQALVAIERSVVLDPDHPEHRLTAGWLQSLAEDHVRADIHLATITGLPEVDPHILAEAAHLRAQISIKRDRPQAAVSLLATAVRLFPDNGHFQNTLGTLHMLLGRGNDARRALERASQLLDTWTEPCLNLALLMESANQPELAAAHYTEALRRDPANGKAAEGIKKTTLVPVVG